MKYINYILVFLIAIVFSSPIWADALVPLPTNQGGTGLSSPGTSGNVLTSNGTIWTSAAPTGGGSNSFATSTFANTDRLVWSTLQATWSSMDDGDVLFNSATYYKKKDLTNDYRFRTVRAMGTAGPAGTSIKLQYSTDLTNWYDANSTAADDCTLVGTASTPCPWATLVEGARTDVWLRYISVGGTGTNVSFRDLTTEFNVLATTDTPNATTTRDIPWSVGGTYLQWSNIPLAKSGTYYQNFGSATYIKVADLEKANKYRIHAAVATSTSANNDPQAGTTIDVQFSTNKTNWYNLQSGTASPATGTGELDVSVTSELNTLVTGDWVDIATGAKGDVWLRFVAYGGNGVKDVRFAYLDVEIETQLQADVTIGSDWSFDTNFGQSVLTPSSTIPVWLKDTLYASSSVFIQGTNFATTTIGSHSDYIRFEQGNFGGVIGSLPILRGILDIDLLPSAQGLLSWSGLVAIEDPLLNDDEPSLTLSSADVGTTLNTFNFTYATSTHTLKAIGTSTASFVFDNSSGGETMKVGIATSSPWANLSVDGTVAFQGTDFATTTIGRANSYLTIANKDILGGLVYVPTLFGTALGTLAGDLNGVGINNSLLITEDVSENTNPSLIIGGQNLNSGNISFATSTSVLSYVAEGGHTFGLGDSDLSQVTSLNIGQKYWAGNDVYLPFITPTDNQTSTIVPELLGFDTGFYLVESTNSQSPAFWSPALFFSNKDFTQSGGLKYSTTSDALYTSSLSGGFGIATSTPSFGLSLDGIALFNDNISSSTVNSQIKFSSGEFLSSIQAPIITGIASNGANALATLREFLILDSQDATPVLRFASSDFLENASIGYATSTDVMSFDLAEGGYTFNTVAGNNTSLTIKERDLSGLAIDDLKIPTLFGGIANSAIGPLNLLGVNNGLIVLEDSTQNAGPSLLFGAADIGDTGNSGSISYGTSTAQLYLSAGGGLFFNSDDGDGNYATSSSNGGFNLSNGCYAINNVCVGGGDSQWLTSGDDVFYANSNGGGAGVLNDWTPSFILGNLAGSTFAGMYYSTTTDALSFASASGGYSFDDDVTIAGSLDVGTGSFVANPGFVGISTSTPFANLSVKNSFGDYVFLVANGSNDPKFWVKSNGFTTIGASSLSNQISPLQVYYPEINSNVEDIAKFQIEGNSSFNLIGNATTTNSRYTPANIGYISDIAYGSANGLYGFTTTANDINNGNLGLVHIGGGITDNTSPFSGNITAPSNRKLVTLGSIFDPKMTILASGNVGVGSSTPFAKLSVDGDVRFQGSNFATTTIGSLTQYITMGKTNHFGTDYASIDFTGPSSNKIGILSNDIYIRSTGNPIFGFLKAGSTKSPIITFDPDNDLIDFSAANFNPKWVFENSVGIGTSTPFKTFSVSGSVAFAPSSITTNTGASTYSLCLASSGEVTKNSDNETCIASSIRFKKDVKPLDLGLTDLLKLKAVTFEYKDLAGQKIGLIAEDTQAVDSRLVSLDEKGLPNGIRWSEITTMIVKSVQQLNSKLTNVIGLVINHESRLQKLEKENQLLKARLELLENK